MIQEQEPLVEDNMLPMDECQEREDDFEGVIVEQPQSKAHEILEDDVLNYYQFTYPRFPRNNATCGCHIWVVLIVFTLFHVSIGVTLLFFRSIVFLGIIYLVLYPFVMVLWYYGYFTCSFTGRHVLMKQLHCLYYHCCCRLDCASKLPLEQAIHRNVEDPILDSKAFIENMSRDQLLITVLEELNILMPSFFFAYLPTGSLREGFGKLMPSTSCIASDYDIMILPESHSVGYEPNSGCVFSVIDKEINEGFVWLKLDDTYLTQWKEVCLKRRVEEEGMDLLSSKLMKNKIQNVIVNSQRLREVIVKDYNQNVGTVEVLAETRGPAINVEVNMVVPKSCCKSGYKRKIFDADYTVGLHCKFWPPSALGFFNPDRRKFWPDVSLVERIRQLGCHVVPKSSENFLLKIVPEQVENTTYGQSPGLEWRYSFSQAEIILADNVPFAARSAYIALKAVNKRHLDRVGKKLGSYALKTLLLTLMECKPPSYWNGPRQPVVEGFFMDLLNYLKSCLEMRNCPHYWLPNINLFASLTEKDFQKKMKLLAKIIRNPSAYVADGYLEYVRWCRLKCCYCGAHGALTQLIYQNGMEGDVPLPAPCILCVNKNCLYDSRSNCCGPCPYDSVSVDVY